MFRKRVRKWAARAVITGFIPVMVDVASEPYARRGLARSWLHGAGKLAAAAVIGWAASEFEHSRLEGP